MLAPYLAPLLFPIGATSFWVAAMNAFSPIEQLIFRSLLVISFAALVIATGSIVVCLWRGSNRQRLLSLLAIPASFPIAFVGLMITYAILPRVYWV